MKIKMLQQNDALKDNNIYNNFHNPDNNIHHVNGYILNNSKIVQQISI